MQCKHKLNSEARLRNQFYPEQTLSIKHFEFVSVALVIQNATGMRHIVICDLSGYTMLFGIIS